MTPIQFIAYGLSPGQEVELDLKNTKEPIRCFFKGFRVFMGSRVALGINDLVPLFCERTKAGKMGKAKIKHPTHFRYINQIRPLKHSVFSLEDIKGWRLASMQMNTTTYPMICKIINEMASIFPGKRIPLHPDYRSRVRVMDFENDSTNERPGYILTIGTDENGYINFEIELDGQVKLCVEEEVDIENYSRLLDNLAQSIVRPPQEKDTGTLNAQTTLRLNDYTYKTLPCVNDKPYVTEILQQLRVNLWWRSLSEKEKEQCLVNPQMDIDMMIKNFLQEYNLPEDFPIISKCDFIWNNMGPNHKYHIFMYETNYKDICNQEKEQ